MAKKTTSKLALRRETLRQLTSTQLGRVAGGLSLSLISIAQDTRQINSTDPSIDPAGTRIDVYGAIKPSY